MNPPPTNRWCNSHRCRLFHEAKSNCWYFKLNMMPHRGVVFFLTVYWVYIANIIYLGNLSLSLFPFYKFFLLHLGYFIVHILKRIVFFTHMLMHTLYIYVERQQAIKIVCFYMYVNVWITLLTCVQQIFSY